MGFDILTVHTIWLSHHVHDKISWSQLGVFKWVTTRGFVTRLVPVLRDVEPCVFTFSLQLSFDRFLGFVASFFIRRSITHIDQVEYKAFSVELVRTIFCGVFRYNRIGLVCPTYSTLLASHLDSGISIWRLCF